MVFGYEREAFIRYGLAIPIQLEIAAYPHALITGSSGSGKSKSLLFLIGKLLQSDPNIVLYVCDFKNSEDFAFLEGYEHYYTGENCYLGVIDYYKNFTQIRADRTSQNQKRYLLIFDEYPAFINYLQLSLFRDSAKKIRPKKQNSLMMY